MPARIAAVFLDTTDPDGLAAFYRAAFDLGEPSHVLPGHLGFTLPNTYVGFDLVTSTDSTPRPRTCVWFRVDDATAAHARLLALGAIDEMTPDSTCSPGETLAIVRDPEGNRVGLLSES